MDRLSQVTLLFLDIFVMSWCQPPAEQRLHHFLLMEKSYNKLIRPTGSTINGTLDTKLNVKLGMILSQLLDVSEKNQILTANLWLQHRWVDLRLQWDPEDFLGIDTTHIPSGKLWRPDITLYNNADGEFTVKLLTKAMVHHTGLILWEPPAIYKTYCPINVEFFPFDQQECFMKFSSWSYDGHEVDLQHIWEDRGVMVEDHMEILRGIDLCEYYQNVEWDIINVTARRNEKFYPCCVQPFPDITFYITIRRRTLFYTINLIMPCVAISCLTVLVFYLPSTSGEKITLSISILLALTVFFLLLSDINPPTSLVIPLIGKYLLFTMILVTMSIFLTVHTLAVSFRSPATHKMSPWVRRVFTEVLPKILLMKRPVKRPTTNKISSAIQETRVFTDLPQVIPRFDREVARDGLRNRPCTGSIDILDTYPREIRASLLGVQYMESHFKKHDEEKAEERDWNYVAMVMDRLFLVIFTTACVSGTLGIFLNAPALYDPRTALTRRDFNCSA